MRAPDVFYITQPTIAGEPPEFLDWRTRESDKPEFSPIDAPYRKVTFLDRYSARAVASTIPYASVCTL